MEHRHNPNSIPASIILAGIIIALAIVFSNKGGSAAVAPKAQPAAVKAAGVTIEAAAKIAGISYKDVESCMSADTYKSKVESFSSNAQSTGGSGTPWSIIVSKSGKKYALSGAQPIEKVKSLIEQALKDELPAGDAKLDKMSPVTDKDHIKGDINAPVKIVEYSDIDCPFCKRFHTTMQEIMDSYGKDGKVAWVYRHFPLTQLHPDAFNKAEASECITAKGGNDKFWSFVDALSK